VKILVISNLYPPDFIGGYELCCSQMVDGLLDRAHDVRVLTTTPRTPCFPVEHVVREMELANCYDPFSVLRAEPVTRKTAAGRAAIANAHNVHVLIDNLRRFRPDVVYLWNLLGIGGLGLVGCLEYLNIPWVWHLEDCAPRLLCCLRDEELPGLAAALGQYLSGSYLAVSDRVVNEIKAGGVELKGPVELVPNWVLGERPPMRSRFYRPGELLRIVSAGQMGRHKGIHLLIEAAALVRAHGHENFRIDLYGKVGDLSGPCPQEDLIACYARHEYDLFAFPTWAREPFGCAPVEAAAYGTVMVMSESCGVGEWFVDRVHCLKVARTAEAFAEVLTAVLEGRLDLKPIGRRASAVVWRDFRRDVLLPQVERTLARAADRGRLADWPSKATAYEDVYRLALMADKLTEALVQESAGQAA
jgi:glycosyltransferase involved in cell wall biosynthesis